MSIEELENIVMKECEFLAYYIDEYNAHLVTNPNDNHIKNLLELLTKKYKDFEEVYVFIRRMNGDIEYTVPHS